GYCILYPCIFSEILYVPNSMQFIADLHLHSKYSRATSKDLDLENINKWARIKGINILAAPDFTHPVWLKEMKSKLVKQENGLYVLDKKFEKNVSHYRSAEVSQKRTPAPEFPSGDSDGASGASSIYFLPATEVSCIYSKGGKCRRLHLMIFLPDFEAVDKFNFELEKRGGKLKSDGRPILGMDAKEILKIMMEISPDAMMVPAHAWTPWFAVFGSKSGFDCLEECFEELTPQIKAIETGLSSDPPMNWRLSQLDDITLISNSDAHSPQNLGREANVFDIEKEKLSYKEIIRIIREGDKKKFQFTIEFFPEEGMYHFDGHRSCGIRFSPVESRKNKNICPVCKKPLTIGVMNRVESLADREEDIDNKNFIPYKSLVPLREIIAEAENKGRATKMVEAIYYDLIAKGKNEFNILLNLSYEELEKISSKNIVEAIKRVRERKLIIDPGYDGVYGTVKIFSEQEREKFKPRQASFI
ncbi:MAG: endonuclease Q family protein, partial [bacterium]